VIRAGKANMFLSDIFSKTLVDSTGVSVELYDTDGAKGAALGAGIGVSYFKKPKEAFVNMKKIGVIEPDFKQKEVYENIYGAWKSYLEKNIRE
jgi:xylulokinase